ncbi:MAG: indole-3-glycerol phosphate synthase TrpC [Gammaproteobacteria bacterium]|nr:indole-3-glycerol phosphate synthase TrpC [Gammaproteobacteria bacterium]
MRNILEDIIQSKREAVADLKCDAACKRFKKALSSNGLSFIGEIKRKSPSKGVLARIKNPLDLLQAYIKGGIAAVSVLTEPHYFEGSICDLKSITNQLEKTCIPVLRKDFIIDEIQLIESVKAGADAVLLIASVLKEKTKGLMDAAAHLGLESIVEVHTNDELQLALNIKAEMVMINNRNLYTFEEDLETCLRLVKQIPNTIVKIAASAIRTPEDIQKMSAAGFDAVLIGEALVRAENPAHLLNEMRAVL